MPFADDDGTNEEEDPFSGLDGLPSTGTAPAIRLASPDGQEVAGTAAGSSAPGGSAVNAPPPDEAEPSTDDAAAPIDAVAKRFAAVPPAPRVSSRPLSYLSIVWSEATAAQAPPAVLRL